MTSKLTSVLSWILFVACFLMAGLAVWERLLNAFDFTIFGGQYAPSRLLELSGTGILFVIALQLRELKQVQKAARGGGSA
jgi:hypothetical protein